MGTCTSVPHSLRPGCENQSVDTGEPAWVCLRLGRSQWAVALVITDAFSAPSGLASSPVGLTGDHISSPLPRPLPGQPVQDSTTSCWRPSWSLYQGDITSCSPVQTAGGNDTIQPCKEREVWSGKILRGWGAPSWGLLSAVPPFSPLSTQHSWNTLAWGSSASRTQPAFLFIPAPSRHGFLFLSPSPLFFFNMQVAMKNLLMKYLLRSLLWARLITYLCLSLASHILNTHLLSV